MAEDFKDLEVQIAERNKAKNVIVAPAPNPHGELVEEAFNTALIARVKTDTAVQEKLVDAAGKVIDSKVSAVINRADTEDKETYFDNNVDACALFGYVEKTTEKSLVKTMKAAKYIMDTLYIWTLGMFLVMPIMFFANKVKVVIKRFWIAVVLGILIYALIVATPLLIGLIPQG